MRPSLLSRVLLVAVCSAAAVGWLGPRLGPEDLDLATAAEAPTAARQNDTALAAGIQPGVRSRAAWQPSPVPPQYSRGTAPTAAAPAIPASGFRAAGSERPATTEPIATTRNPEASSQSSSIPTNEVLTSEQLDAMFDGALPAERGDWRTVPFYSRSLKREVSYLAYLPFGYEMSDALYPVLYLLHGVGSPEAAGAEEWLGYGITEDLDRMIASGMIQPMLVILPEGEQGFWMNHADGGLQWADFVALDLVRHVDATFRTDPVRARRAVGGLSMGGHAALQLSLNYSSVFGIAGAHSPTLRTFETSPDFFGDPKWFAKYDPLSLVTGTNAAPRIATWIDLGNEDEWLPAAETLRRAYEAKRAPLQFHVLEGEHEGWYWQFYLPEYLTFYSSALNAPTKTAQGAPVVADRLLARASLISSPS